MVVLIAPEKDQAKELEVLHKLFENGLEYYHLRKPEKDIGEHRDYLEAIDSRFHSKIVVHYFHELLNEYDLKGIHFHEQKRKDELADAEGFEHYFEKLEIAKREMTVSSSFHDPGEIASCELPFDYHLLSPVFSSISKPGYEGKGFEVKEIEKKIIGMGGVDIHNVDEVLALGYKGVGVLGGIWQSDMPIEDFIQMKHSFVANPYMHDGED